jgi:hypothetical protein
MFEATRSNDYRFWGALVVLAGLSVSSSARADSLSCDGRIVSSGDSRYDVKAVCGEPDAVGPMPRFNSFTFFCNPFACYGVAPRWCRSSFRLWSL